VSGKHDQADSNAIPAAPDTSEERLQRTWNKVVGRRAFLQRAGLASAVVVPASGIAASSAAADSKRRTSEPTEGDFAILRFLCAAEIIESDLWEQYAGFGGQATAERPNDGQNPFYVSALENLDGDMPQYISDNTDDEESHQAFINAYLMSKGQRPVNLEPFRTLPPSPATGGGSKNVLTNLTSLNVDTSWYLRYRAETNPDFGATFGQAVTINNQSVIPVSDAETPPGDTISQPPIPNTFACSVVRPTIDSLAGARAAVRALTADGLFNGQSGGFSDFINRLAREADAAVREIG
jgi:hypothetical protein